MDARQAAVERFYRKMAREFRKMGERALRDSDIVDSVLECGDSVASFWYEELCHELHLARIDAYR